MRGRNGRTRIVLRTYECKGFAKLGDGLYLKKEGKIYDGKGLLLGPTEQPIQKYSYPRYVTVEINDFILT